MSVDSALSGAPFKAGVGKGQPVGPTLLPTTSFCTAQDLRMGFTVLSG